MGPDGNGKVRSGIVALHVGGTAALRRTIEEDGLLLRVVPTEHQAPIFYAIYPLFPLDSI